MSPASNPGSTGAGPPRRARARGAGEAASGGPRPVKKLEDRARMWRKAQAEVRERDEFLSIASHELRTPVTALQLQLQLLQRAAQRSIEELPRVLEGKMDVLERQTRRIALLVNELLDVSRMRLGKLEAAAGARPARGA